MLDYHLIENQMTPAQEDAMAQVTNVRSYSEDEIADMMLKRGTLLTKADILAVLAVYREVIADVVADGCSVNTPLCRISPSIAGVFNGMNDSFDPSRHTVKANVNASAILREAAKRVKTHKIQVSDPVPCVTEVKDIETGSINDIITQRNVIEIFGSRLKFFEDDATNGVFFVPEMDGAPARQATKIVENKPSRLIVMVPVLLVGEHHLEIRTTYSGGNKPTHTLKVGRFNKPLRVTQSIG